MSLIRKHVAVLQAWACLDLVLSCLTRFLEHWRQVVESSGAWASVVGCRQTSLEVRVVSTRTCCKSFICTGVTRTRPAQNITSTDSPLLPRHVHSTDLFKEGGKQVSLPPRKKRLGICLEILIIKTQSFTLHINDW